MPQITIDSHPFDLTRSTARATYTRVPDIERMGLLVSPTSASELRPGDTFVNGTRIMHVESVQALANGLIEVIAWDVRGLSINWKLSADAQLLRV